MVLRALRLMPILAMACAAGPSSGAGEDATSSTTTVGTGTGTGESSGGDETGTGSTGTGTDTDTGESGFTTGPMPDTLAEPKPCDLWEPDCPEGEKCTSLAKEGPELDTNACMTIMGDGVPGDPCMGFGDVPGLSGLDDCGDGSMCWSVDPNTGVGYCVGFCAGKASDPICPDGTSCRICANCVTVVCLSDCHPLDAMGVCPSDTEVCISNSSGDGFSCAPGSGDDAPFGEACDWANQCGYGLFCAGTEFVPGCMGGAGCCSTYCDVTQPNTCPGKDGGQECVAWFEQGQAPQGYENVGGCGIPG